MTADSKPHTSSLDKENTNHLLEPFLYLNENPGKAIRSLLIEAFNDWLCLTNDTLVQVTEIVDMLHNASLLIDDIEDNSSLRRGLPVAHSIYGVPLTINCANYVYFLALEKVLALKRPETVNIYTEELINLHIGQGNDLYWRDNYKCPSEEDYLQMINNKTSGLLRLAVRLMQACAPEEKRGMDFVPLVNLLGTHFQVRDDYVNLKSSQYFKEKGFCEDITEGKFSYPIIHCIQFDKHNRLLNILKKRTQDHEVLQYAVSVIKSTGSMDYTVEYIRKMETLAREEIGRLGGNEKLMKILDKLAVIYADHGAPSPTSPSPKRP